MSATRLQERLLGCVSGSSESSCWNWTGQISNTGYGRCQVRDGQGNIRILSAQQASYEAFAGPLPEGMLVRQTCNNRLCINPGHLEVFDASGSDSG
jgi:hypothetical protein